VNSVSSSSRHLTKARLTSRVPGSTQTTAAARLSDLLAQLSTNIAVHRTVDDAARAQDCFVLVDAEHVIRRPVAAQSRGVVLTDDEKEARAMRERFDEIWQSSVPAVSATKLGL